MSKPYVPFLSLNKKGTKELSLRGAFYKDAPLKEPPPKPERPEDFNNQAEMYRFPPIRSQSHLHFGQKIGTFFARTGFKLRCSRAYGGAAGDT